jgi:hypothetical protein
MFLGNRVDDACKLYLQRQLAGEILDPRAAHRRLPRNWKTQLAAEQHDVLWQAHLGGADAIALARRPSARATGS